MILSIEVEELQLCIVKEDEKRVNKEEKRRKS